MLILTRKIHEEISIGKDIEIRFLGVKGAQICIGIVAPKEMPIHRKEIFFKAKKKAQALREEVGHDATL